MGDADKAAAVLVFSVVFFLAGWTVVELAITGVIKAAKAVYCKLKGGRQ